MTALASTPHPVLACAEAIEHALKNVRDANPTFMRTPEKAAALVALTRLRSQLEELTMRVMAAADDVAETTGARDVAAWVAHETRQDRPVTRAEADLARTLDRGHDVLADGVRDGEVSIDQARVIAKALADLPADLDPEVRAEAEAALVGLAAHHPPAELRTLGRRILQVVAPEIGEAHEAKLLEAAERTAAERTTLHLRERDGMLLFSGAIPGSAGHRFRTALEAFTNPRKQDGTTTAAGVGSYPRRLGQAFTQLLETLDPARLPIHGGDATTLVVTIPLEQLQQDLGVGAVIGGDSISASEARRLACNAKIVPAVLGGNSELLDLGRARRLFTAAQRKALILRDRTCRAEGCDIPGTWTEAHHWIPWHKRGRTDLDNAVLLCHLHHQRVHDTTWHTERLPNGDVRFTRRR